MALTIELSELDLSNEKTRFIENEIDIIGFCSQDISNVEQTVSLTQLLPYDLEIKTKKALKTSLIDYQTLLKIGLEAINEIKHGNLEKFDSLVGENACQIRAVMLIFLINKKFIATIDLEKLIIPVIGKIDSLLEPKKIEALMFSEISMKALIEKENLFVNFTTADLFLILSFILTQTKTIISDGCQNSCPLRKEKAEPKKLKKHGDISSSFTVNLIKKSRKLLSIISINFIRKIANKSDDNFLRKMVSDEFTIKHINLFCIPMFWTYKTLFSVIREENIPVIIHAKFLQKGKKDSFSIIDEDYLIFEPGKNLEKPQLISKKSLQGKYPSKNVIIIQGVVHLDEDVTCFKKHWITTISSFSHEEIVLAGAADHRQYPAQEKDLIIHSLKNTEFNYFKNFSKKNGFSLENPSSFLIQHVYSSNITNFSSLNTFA